MNRLEEQLKFMVEIDKLKKITRQTYLSDVSRKENDAEHSWHLATMAIFLSEYANEPVDVLQVVKMVLVHDFVEIDAGDTYLYDAKGTESKEKREMEAANRIFNLMPEDQAKELFALWREFEDRETKESKFANALDRVQPMLLNDATDGLSWKEHDVTIDQVMAMNERISDGSHVLWEHMLGIFEKHMEKGNIKRSE